MRFVPIKSAHQQAILTLHCVRQGFVEERTAAINRVRGLLTEFGVVFPQRVGGLLKSVHELIEKIHPLAKGAVTDLLDHVHDLGRRIAQYDHRLRELAKQDPRASRIMALRGVGALSAVAITASVSDVNAFKNGRQFAAWLGLTPKQHSSGGRTILGAITKRGNDYLRMLLIQGARAAMRYADRHTDRLSTWVKSVQSRRGYHKANIAMAAKNARIIWALLARGSEFELRAAAGR